MLFTLVVLLFGSVAALIFLAIALWTAPRWLAARIAAFSALSLRGADA